ncbi:MAG: DUF488 domain-containing protein [Nitrospira sp.]|nr:DUF488 domain-containing protein [Nitrospira sp.]
MKILVKRIYEPADEADGFRVLVDRLWPRGMSKARAALDLWLPDLGPSTELRKWFNHDPTKWDEFCCCYQAELKENKVLVEELKGWAKERPMTLLYSAKDEAHNQAVALRSFLLRQKEGLQQKRRDVAEEVQGLKEEKCRTEPGKDRCRRSLGSMERRLMKRQAPVQNR